MSATVREVENGRAIIGAKRGLERGQIGDVLGNFV